MSFLRRTFLGMLVTALWAVPAQSVVPVWDPNGVSLCGPDGCRPGAPRLLPDGAGGVYVAWTDERNSTSTGTDIYLQRLTGEGQSVPGWPEGGVPICVAPRNQARVVIAPDGMGGVLLAWEDSRDASESQFDIYAQRILPTGEIAPGWIPDGAPVCRNVEYQYYPEICTDGEGGAFIAWRDIRDYLELGGFGEGIYVQHLTADGSIADGWVIDGNRLMPHECGGPQLLPDGSGGVIVAWGDGRRGTSSIEFIDVYATRLQADGQRHPQWPTTGLLLAGSHAIGLDIVLASESEFYVPMLQGTGPGFGDVNYRVQKATFEGAIAADWPPEGVLFCCSNSNSRQALQVAPDALGGLLAAWYENNRFATGSDIFAIRLLPTGEIAPGWAQDGVVASDPTIPNDSAPDLASDGEGGAYVAWVRLRPFAEYNTTYVQHLSAAGQPSPGWPLYGYALSLPRNTDNPAVLSNDSGSVIVVWTELSGLTGSGLFGQRLLDDDYVSTRPVVMSAEASEAGIRVIWFAKDARSLESSVYRRTGSSAWAHLAAPEATGPDELRYDDVDVVPGERYAYRLGYFDGATESFTDEVWVEAVSPLAFALEGFRPNPAVGLPIVSLTLAKSEPARLEVFDLRGRLILRRDLSGLGAGRHSVSLDDGARLAPGVYVLRLTQGDQVARVRGVVLN